MASLNPQAQAVVAAFGRQPGVTRDQLNNLQAAIQASPVLIDQINAAVAQGHLKAIVPLTNPNAGGEYDSTNRAMRLPLGRLTTPPPGPDQHLRASLNAGEITFVLGHELQHGFNRAATQKSNADFANAVRRIAEHDPAPRDYTAPLAARLAQNRRDEASAQIAGWNALVSRVRSTNPNPSLQDIYDAQPGRTADFIDRQGTRPNYTYTLKPGLTLNADLSLSPSPANVEAMGRNFFDKPPRQPGGLGPLGNSDYVNYYARSAVSYIAQMERHFHPPRPGATSPQMALDLARLRLSEKLLEENGIDLGRHTQPLPYYDLGTRPPGARLFQHTAGTHRHVWPIETAERLRDETPAARARTPADPGHPDHALLEKLRERVRTLDREAGKGWDEFSERLAGSALLMAKKAGFTAEDELVLAFNRPTDTHAAGEILHLARTGPHASADPAANRTHMSTADALSQPAEQRYRQVDDLERARQRELLAPAAPMHAVEVEGPARGGRAMAM